MTCSSLRFLSVYGFHEIAGLSLLILASQKIIVSTVQYYNFIWFHTISFHYRMSETFFLESHYRRSHNNWYQTRIFQHISTHNLPQYKNTPYDSYHFMRFGSLPQRSAGGPWLSTILRMSCFGGVCRWRWSSRCSFELEASRRAPEGAAAAPPRWSSRLVANEAVLAEERVVLQPIGCSNH